MCGENGICIPNYGPTLIYICACKPQATPEPPKLCQELEGELCTNDKHCPEGGICIRDGLEKLGKCQCKHQPTPEPPKQCQELEGYLCISDKKCGKGGHCIRDGLEKLGKCQCKHQPTPEPPKQCQ